MNNNPLHPFIMLTPLCYLWVGGEIFSGISESVIKIVGPCPTVWVFYPGGKYANALDLEEKKVKEPKKKSFR